MGKPTEQELQDALERRVRAGLVYDDAIDAGDLAEERRTGILWEQARDEYLALWARSREEN